MELFEWDSAKAESNWLKHGVKFEDAARMLLGLTLTWSTGRGTENRFASIGIIEGSAIVVVWTPRANAVRIVSARRARRSERRTFDQEVRRSIESGWN